MSLNGLDTPVVQEAYQQAVTEAGGWSVHFTMSGWNGDAEV